MEMKGVVHTPTGRIFYRRRLAVLCPICGKRVCDISTKSRMNAFSEDDAEKPPWEPDVYIICVGCKTELALYRLTEKKPLGKSTTRANPVPGLEPEGLEGLTNDEEPTSSLIAMS